MLAADLQVHQPEACSAPACAPVVRPRMPTARGTRTIVGPREGVPKSTVDDGDQREHPQQPAAELTRRVGVGEALPPADVDDETEAGVHSEPGLAQ